VAGLARDVHVGTRPQAFVNRGTRHPQLTFGRNDRDIGSKPVHYRLHLDRRAAVRCNDDHMSHQAPGATTITLLLCRVPPRLIGIPVEHVIETMRPLPIERISGAPRYVAGVSVIRGAAVPVVDATRLFDEGGRQADRFVTVRAGDRTVALAVGQIVGTRTLRTESLRSLPPLLRSAARGIIDAIGAVDDELLLVLRSSHLVPEDTRHSAAATVGP
jgi:purine-binding chemotaxis protein CheW